MVKELIRQEDLTEDDFTLADATATAGTPVKLGYYQNDRKGTIVYFGGGYIYALIKNNTPAVQSGKLKVYLTDPNEIHQELVYELRTEFADASQTDKTQMIKVPVFKDIGIGYKSKIVLYFESDDNATIDVSECSLIIPIVVKYRLL